MQQPVQAKCYAMLPLGMLQVTGMGRLLRAAGFHMGSFSDLVILQPGQHTRPDSCTVTLSLGFSVHRPWSLNGCNPQPQPF